MKYILDKNNLLNSYSIYWFDVLNAQLRRTNVTEGLYVRSENVKDGCKLEDFVEILNPQEFLTASVIDSIIKFLKDDPGVYYCINLEHIFAQLSSNSDVSLVDKIEIIMEIIKKNIERGFLEDEQAYLYCLDALPFKHIKQNEVRQRIEICRKKNLKDVTPNSRWTEEQIKEFEEAKQEGQKIYSNQGYLFSIIYNRYILKKDTFDKVDVQHVWNALYLLFSCNFYQREDHLKLIFEIKDYLEGQAHEKQKDTKQEERFKFDGNNGEEKIDNKNNRTVKPVKNVVVNEEAVKAAIKKEKEIKVFRKKAKELEGLVNTENGKPRRVLSLNERIKAVVLMKEIKWSDQDILNFLNYCNRNVFAGNVSESTSLETIYKNEYVLLFAYASSLGKKIEDQINECSVWLELAYSEDGTKIIDESCYKEFTKSFSEFLNKYIFDKATSVLLGQSEQQENSMEIRPKNKGLVHKKGDTKKKVRNEANDDNK